MLTFTSAVADISALSPLRRRHGQWHATCATMAMTRPIGPSNTTTSLVQHLPIPESVPHFSLPPPAVTALLTAYMAAHIRPPANELNFQIHLSKILAALRSTTASHADMALPLLSSLTPSSTALESLLYLLTLAKFSVLPSLPSIEPPSSDAIPLASSAHHNLDPTLITHSQTLRDHMSQNQTPLSPTSCYPYLFIATRGLSVLHTRGRLLPQKLRAIERLCYAWFRTPLTLLVHVINRTPFRRLQTPNTSSRPFLKRQQRTGINQNDDEKTSKYVRRVLFSGRVDKGWQGVKNLFKPSFIQEPAHEHMIVMFREVQIDRQKMRQKKRTAVIEQIKQSLLSAINPVPVSRRKMAVEGREREMEKKHFEAFETPVGKVKAVNIQLFRDVPWANVMHFFPSTYVLPATRDLLRVDAVTFVGLMSALVTYIRQSENVWVVGSLVSTFVLYLFRVGFGWRQALVAYNERLAKVRAEKVVGQGRCSVDTLVALACEEAFLEVACVWMAEWGGFEEDAQHIQRAVFQHASLSERSVLKWRAWLVDNGLHHN